MSEIINCARAFRNIKVRFPVQYAGLPGSFRLRECARMSDRGFRLADTLDRAPGQP
jgi:hypothetical protein